MNRDEVPSIGMPIEKILLSIRQARDFTICGVVVLQKDIAEAMCDIAECLDAYPGYINVKTLNEWTTRKSTCMMRLREISTRKPEGAA